MFLDYFDDIIELDWLMLIINYLKFESPSNFTIIRILERFSFIKRMLY